MSRIGKCDNMLNVLWVRSYYANKEVSITFVVIHASPLFYYYVITAFAFYLRVYLSPSIIRLVLKIINIKVYRSVWARKYT